MTISTQASQAALISGIRVPDSKLANEITEFIRDTESTLLFNHSSRVYYFGALAGQRRGLKFEAELLYAGAMFHDIGLVSAYSSDADRFEVDGANAARDFLRCHSISEQDIDHVWTAIALHTTPGIPQYMHPVVALVTAGVEMDVLGIDYTSFTDSDRNAVVQAFPRTPHFKEDILQAFYDGIKRKPETTFGNVKADVLADKDPGFHRGNFCSVIRNSSWRG
ncbi:HD domain-containing protein [Edaphobacter modestus]|uniref:Metal dependent phosphohydrolase n=1 Tax=Edaphobacter modestus TaxID=388466 RepID=A0A4V2G4S9_9BACT|nr:HD domain-containing protein [Edaphobacter modestus]RZU42196.1 metal dependent phosphohydrolase [Edaphobacter modestus]